VEGHQHGLGHADLGHPGFERAQLARAHVGIRQVRRCSVAEGVTTKVIDLTPGWADRRCACSNLRDRGAGI
jgi:hypothetical protein